MLQSVGTVLEIWRAAAAGSRLKTKEREEMDLDVDNIKVIECDDETFQKCTNERVIKEDIAVVCYRCYSVLMDNHSF